MKRDGKKRNVANTFSSKSFNRVYYYTPLIPKSRVTIARKRNDGLFEFYERKLRILIPDLKHVLPDGRSSSWMLSSAKGKGERSANGRENVGSVVSNQLGTSGGNRGGYLGRDFRDWPFPPDTRGGRDGWPRTDGQVKQTEEGRKGGCPDGRRKGSRGRSRGQSLGIGWRLFSASTSISICFQRCNELVFLFVLARFLTRARVGVVLRRREPVSGVAG